MRERILPSVGLTAHIPNVCRMEPVKWRPRDITEEVLSRMLPTLPKHMVRLQHVCIVGKPGSGKSELMKWLSWRACKQYGRDNVHIINTDDLRVAIALLDDRPVQLLLIDDAMQYASSRKVYEQAELVGEFQRLRHLAREASGRRAACSASSLAALHGPRPGVPREPADHLQYRPGGP